MPLSAEMYRICKNGTLRGKVVRRLAERAFCAYRFSTADSVKCRQADKWRGLLNPWTSFCNGLEIQALIAPQDFQRQRLPGVDLAGTLGLAFRLDGVEGDVIAGNHGIADFETGLIGWRAVGDFLHEVDVGARPFPPIPDHADPSGPDDTGFNSESRDNAMRNEAGKIIRSGADGVIRVSVPVEQQLAGFDVDHAERQRDLGRVVGLSTFPLLYFTDDDGFRTGDFADTQRMGLVGVLQLHDLFFKDLFQFRSFHDGNIEVQ